MTNAPSIENSQNAKNDQLARVSYNTDGENMRDLSAAAQRARILDYLQKYRALTTLQARHLLNVMHPAARVMELRKRGHNIVTSRRKDVDSEGRFHHVAEYVLMPGG